MNESTSSKPESREELQRKFEARFKFAETTGDALTEKNVDKITELAKEKVENEVSKVQRECMGDLISRVVGTSRFMPIHSENGKQFQNMMQAMLIEPFKSIGRDWKITLEQAAKMKKNEKNFSVASINEYYIEVLKDSEKLVKAYLDKISKLSLAKKIDATLLTRMYDDMNIKAINLISVIENPHNKEDVKELLDSLLWTMNGSAALNSDNKAFKNIVKEMNLNFSSKEKEKETKMDLVWMSLTFLNDHQKIEIVKQFKGDKKEFLKAGNARGIFSAYHFKEVLGINDEQFDSQFNKEKIQITFAKLNDFSKQAKEIARDSQESVNYINKVFTAENILTMYAKFFAATTVIGNSIITLSSNGFNADSVEKIVTNGNVLLGAGIYGLVNVNEDDRIDRFLSSSGERDNNVRRASRDILNAEIQGPHGDKFDRFFKSNEHKGAKVFYQFIQSQKKKKEGKFEKDDFTIANFKKYLDEQSKEKPGEYEDIKRSFTQMGLNNLDKEGNNKVYNFAKAFDGLNLFGKKYTEEINLIRSKDYVS